MRRALPFCSLLLLTSCSIVKSSWVRDDWATSDSRVVKRLAVVVQPTPSGQQKPAEVFARVARRYVNQKRDFLVKQERVVDAAPELSAVCGGEDAIEGMLLLTPSLTDQGAGVELEVKGTLVRCPDAREVWKGQAAGGFPTKDPGLTEVTQVYVQELGPEAERFVAPALNALRPLLDTLPQPQLTDADVDEKLTLD